MAQAPRTGRKMTIPELMSRKRFLLSDQPMIRSMSFSDKRELVGDWMRKLSPMIRMQMFIEKADGLEVKECLEVMIDLVKFPRDK